MNEAPADQANEVLQPSIDSARKTAFKGLARQAIGGSLTLDEYTERAAGTGQVTTAEELDALLQGPAEDSGSELAARRPRWLVSVLAGGRGAVAGGCATISGS